MKQGLQIRRRPKYLNYVENFFSVGSPKSITNANKFPFCEAFPFYLAPRKIKKKPPNFQFLMQNINKKLDKYYKNTKIEDLSLKKKYKEAERLVKIRNAITGFRDHSELSRLKDYWIYRLPSYLDSGKSTVVSTSMKKFIKKYNKKDSLQLRYLSSLLDDWFGINGLPEKFCAHDLHVRKFKNALGFVKRSLKHNQLFVGMNMGARMKNLSRFLQLRRAATLLNLIYDHLSPGFDLKFRGANRNMHEKPIKQGRSKNKVTSLIIRSRPKFNEKHCLQSICKGHFNEIYCPPQLETPEKKEVCREEVMKENKFRIMLEARLPAKRKLKQYAIRGKFLKNADYDAEMFESITRDLIEKGIEQEVKPIPWNHEVHKQLKTDIIPYNRHDYEQRALKIHIPQVLDGYNKFMNDFQQLFNALGQKVPKSRESIEVIGTNDIDSKIKREMQNADFDFYKKKWKEKIRPRMELYYKMKKKLFSERFINVSTSEVSISSSFVFSLHGEEEQDGQEEEKKDQGIAEAEKKKDERELKKEWKIMSVKKTAYIILRFLKDMVTTQYLTDVPLPQDTESEHSYFTPPHSEKVRLPPISAIKAFLSRRKVENEVINPLKYLECCAKRTYNKIKRQEKPVVLDKCREYNKLFAKTTGIPSKEDKSIMKLLQKWDSENIMDASKELKNVSSLSSVFSESDRSVAFVVEPTVFDYLKFPSTRKRTNHLEILSLLLLFLSLSQKILSVRKALKKYQRVRGGGDLRKKRKIRKCRKRKSRNEKVISLPRFRNFLSRRYELLPTEDYVDIAKRYCPDYIFYNRPEDLDKNEVAAPVGSAEEIHTAQKEAGTKADVFIEADRSEESSEEEGHERIDICPKGKGTISDPWADDKSYMSWNAPPCEEDFASKTRVYLMKHSSEWAPFQDFREIGVDNKFKSSDFFEFPKVLGIPRLVTRFYRHLPSQKMPESYILDPSPKDLKRDKSCWLRRDGTVPYYEKYDHKLQGLSKYFKIFWIIDKNKELTRDQIMRQIFAYWCGEVHSLFDETVSYFQKFVDTIEAFDNEALETKRIFDAKDVVQSEWEWIKCNNYLENVTPVELLNIEKWRNKLENMYNTHALTNRTSIVTLVSRSSEIEGNVPYMRTDETVELPKGFPIKDMKSLKEVLQNFQNAVKSYCSQRVCLYGENYRPLTDYYMKCITEECGFVETHGKPSDHPNIRLAPSKAICYSDREKQFYFHSNNFIGTFQRKYPGRFLRMPFHVRNEYGSMKHICTFICTRRLSWPELNTWKGCMRCVANKLECTPLENAYRPPLEMQSPFTTMEKKKGNVFELSILLTGLLIAAGYDAYCVCGAATYHRSFFGNTDDVSADDSDIDIPYSTNHYKQLNLLPPFKSAWFRDSSCYFDPIPYEDLEIARVNREKKKKFKEHQDTWPKTERAQLAEYDKVEEVGDVQEGNEAEVKEIIKEEDNYAKKLNELYNSLVEEIEKKRAEEMKKAEAKKHSTKTYVYEVLGPIKSKFEEIRNKRLRQDLMKKIEIKNKFKNNGLLESDAKSWEERDYFKWLYGKSGFHSEFHDLRNKDHERSRARNKVIKNITLLDFMDMYDPQKDHLEIMTGERLHYYQRDCARYAKKLKHKKCVIREMDRVRVEKIRTKKFLDTILEEREKRPSASKTFPYPEVNEAEFLEWKHKLPEKNLLQPKDIILRTDVDSLLQRLKFTNLAFLRKLWLNLSKEFRKINSYVRVKEKMGLSNPRFWKPLVDESDRSVPSFVDEGFIKKAIEKLPTYGQMDDISRRSTKTSLASVRATIGDPKSSIIGGPKSSVVGGPKSSIEGGPKSSTIVTKVSVVELARESLRKDTLGRSLEEVRFSLLNELEDEETKRKNKRKKFKKTRENRIHNKGTYLPTRIHCWVLIREGRRNIDKPFFIDVFTGAHYQANDLHYKKISCAWNDKNYYIPRYVARGHVKTREFNFRDNKYWFHLLPLEPVSEVVEKKRKPWWWDAKGHPHLLQHIEMPPYWGRRIRISPLEWDKMFVNSNKKTYYYKRMAIEAYDLDGRPADGLVKRISKFLDMKRSMLETVSTKYSMRKDRLVWRHFDLKSGFVEEKFEEGRPDRLKTYRYLAYLMPGLYTPKEFQFYGKWREDKLSSLLVSDKYLLAEFKEGRMDHLKRVKYTYSRKKTDKRYFVIDEYSRYVKRIQGRYRSISYEFEPWKEYLPNLFNEIPVKLDINMILKYSEYWYWEGNLIKWKMNHVTKDTGALLKSKYLKENKIVIPEPIIYAIGTSLDDNGVENKLRKDKYAKREKSDRVYLMGMARELEQTVCDTLILREYEKIMDVLRVTDELKKLNVTSEKAMDTMKTYFEVEKEMLAKDLEKSSTKKNLMDLWKCEEDSLTGKLFNYFIKEQFWLCFVMGSWDDLNKIFKKVAQERSESSPLFTGYSDLLKSILHSFCQGFGLTDATFPIVPKRTKDLWEIQVDVPIQIGTEYINNLASHVVKDVEYSDSLKSPADVEDVDGDKTNRKKISSQDESETTKQRRLKNTKKTMDKRKKYNCEERYKIDVENYPQLTKLFLHMTKILTPADTQRKLQIDSKPEIKEGWQKNFIDFYISFINTAMRRIVKSTNEDQEGVLDLIDHNHPLRNHIKQHNDFLNVIKRKKSLRKFSKQDLASIQAIYEKRKYTGFLVEDDILKLLDIFEKQDEQQLKDLAMSFVGRYENTYQENKTETLRKKKRRALVKNINFSFEEAPAELKIKSKDKAREKPLIVDHYHLFIRRYKSVGDSVKNVRTFLRDLVGRRRLGSVVEPENQPVKNTDLTFKMFLKKCSLESQPQTDQIMLEPKSNLRYCYVNNHFNYSNKYYMFDNVWRGDWMNRYLGSEANVVNTLPSTKKHPNICVMEVINLFSKPSELKFIGRNDDKIFTLRPILREKEINILDSSMIKNLKRLFPLDYSNLELYEESVDSHILDFPSQLYKSESSTMLQKVKQKDESSKISRSQRKLQSSKTEISSSLNRHRHKPLTSTIKSCPHCINVYYQANKDRLHILQMVEFWRDEVSALSMARPNKTSLPPNILEGYHKSILTYGEYMAQLEDISSIYLSNNNKFACDECRQFKYFLDLLNFKIMYDYFPVGLLFRKFLYKTRPWTIYPDDFEFIDARVYEKMMVNNRTDPILPIAQIPKLIIHPDKITNLTAPIPYYHSRRPSIKRFSLDVQNLPQEFTEEDEAYEQFSTVKKGSAKEKKKKKRKIPYPVIDSDNEIQVELYRDENIRRKSNNKHKLDVIKQCTKKNAILARSIAPSRVWK